ncbi:TPA: hypothetical protein ACJSEQ_001016 [Streptococcus agalactiae]
MPKRNELLNKEIKMSIDKLRYKEPESEHDKRPTFCLVVLILVTVAVILSLFKYFL